MIPVMVDALEKTKAMGADRIHIIQFLHTIEELGESSG
jgi:hypothetical protein